MKKLMAFFFTLACTGALAADVYTCTSSHGEVILKEVSSDSHELDLLGHGVLYMNNAVEVVEGMVNTVSKDFVLNLSHLNFRGKEYISNSSTFVLNSEESFPGETCYFNFRLKKKSLTAKLLYSCKMFLKKSVNMEDNLTCTFQSE